MIDLFDQNVLEVVGNIGGICSILITLISIINNKLTQYVKLKELQSQEFNIIIESSDIVKLGNYLDNEIGKLSVSDYVDSQDLNKRVDSLLNKLTMFVGTDKDLKTDLEEQRKLTAEIADESYDPRYKARLGPEFDKILHELYHGESWNALARLRRHLELVLNDVAARNSINLGRSNLSELISILTNEGIIDSGVAKGLKYVVNVSNRAIHGQELASQEAEQAIFTAGDLIVKLLNSN